MDAATASSAVRRESDALAAAARSAGLGAPIPSCPGWTVTDLLVHCAHGDEWARVIVEQDTVGRVDPPAPDDHPTGDALVPWFVDGAHALAAALAAVDPSKPVWTFSATDRTAGFWLRRRAHESAMHRYDAQLAAGAADPIDAALAADGIDEFLEVFVPRSREPVAAPGARLHFHCTDVPGEWLIVGSDDGVTVTREHAKGDVAARGPASDLLLALRGRTEPGTIELFGDAALFDRFRAATSF